MHTAPLCSRALRRVVVSLALLAGSLSAGGLASAAPGDHAADAVLGHTGFTKPDCNDPALQPNRQLCHPVGIAIDPRSERLFVSDGDNNRVLSWPSAARFINGEAADLVLGQPDFTIRQTCAATSATSICDPNGLAVDATGDLLVTDTDGDRVVLFRPPFTNGMAAIGELGQPDLTTASCAVAADRLCSPRDVALDRAGDLFVADSDNHRVLEFATPLKNGAAAHLVIGQPDFVSNACNQGGTANPGTLCTPKGLALDPAGRLYVADEDNNRVLEYVRPLAPNAAANRVFGSAFGCISGPQGLCAPHRVTLDARGRLYVADSDNNRVLVYTDPLHSSTAETLFGQPNFTSTTATTSARGLAGPQSVAVDAHGNLYATDEDNNRVLRFNHPLD